MTRGAESAAAFQAIGRYVYEFSWLCWDMKMALTSVPGLSGRAYTTIQLITGEMTAAPLADACFAVCEDAIVQGDPAAVKMVRALRARVLTEVSRRNDLVHGDWMIGWVSSTGVEGTDGTVEQAATRDLPPTLSRLKPGRSGPQKWAKEELVSVDLEADRVRNLRQTFEDFLRVLEGRAVTVPGLESVSLTDVYVLNKGKLTRTGPRADEVPPWRAH